MKKALQDLDDNLCLARQICHENLVLMHDPVLLPPTLAVLGLVVTTVGHKGVELVSRLTNNSKGSA